VNDRDEQRVHLHHLADELHQHGFVTELTSNISKPYLQVANSGTPTLNERVLCHQDENEAWLFWWPWKQPIGSVDDLPSVVEKIAAVLKSVEGV